MTSIYDQHDKAFKDVAAYVVLDKQGGRRATIAFKYPRDGAGRLFAYVHWVGCAMVRGYASGCGYDKHSAACSSAARKIEPTHLALSDVNGVIEERALYAAFVDALAKDDGTYWNNHLEAAGFQVLQAV